MISSGPTGESKANTEPDNLPLTVCILAAGQGRRLDRMSRYIHKGLAPVAYQPVLGRIIDRFPRDTRFVMAVGHKAGQLQDFMAVAYPELQVEYVQVDNYDRPGSGPGYSLLCCREKLQAPFVLTTVDTLVEEEIPPPDHDWIGVAEHPEIEKYCSAEMDEHRSVVSIDYRENKPGNQAFIGLAGIYHWQQFFEALAGDRGLVHGEHQLANGLACLLPNLRGETFTWFDTGDFEGWTKANQHFGSDFSNFDKEREYLYFVNGSVVKFFDDAEIARLRVERNRVLGDTCPPIQRSRPNFYSYSYIPGTPFSQQVDDIKFQRWLDWCRERLWLPRELGDEDQARFQSDCLAFYRSKTEARLEMFTKNTGIEDVAEWINGYHVSDLKTLLGKINWSELSSGIPTGFHGDLHFDNTVIPDSREHGEFVLVDWRQEFCGRIEFGDWYYDLAKIHHELFISHDQIKSDSYEVVRAENDVKFYYLTRSDYLSCQKVMQRWVEKEGLDYRRILILTHLIYLNMSPLHHYPFNQLLYYMGKLGLHQILVEGYPTL